MAVTIPKCRLTANLKLCDVVIVAITQVKYKYFYFKAEFILAVTTHFSVDTAKVTLVECLQCSHMFCLTLFVAHFVRLEFLDNSTNLRYNQLKYYRGGEHVHYDCLIIDDEIEVASGTCEYFNLFGISSYYVLNADDALSFLNENTVNLILLDINLGKDSGFNLCKTLRETHDVPILFISARTSSEDVLLALNIGGDDYIQKPYSLSILLAKVKAVLKRYGQKETKSRLSIDITTERITLDGIALELNNMEYKLLRYLIDNKGRIVGKDELFDKVWGDNFVGDGTLSVHVRRLREKIETDPNDPLLIKTIWGVGYVYDEVGT